MADIKLSQLPEVFSLGATDIVPNVASGVTSKITLKNLSATMPQVSSSISASYALTASYAINGGDLFPYTGSAKITGSLGVTGSFSTDRDILINNIRVGIGSGNIASNLVIGSGSFSSNTNGAYNVSIGHKVLTGNLTGFGNVVVGYNIASSSQYGFYNVAIGVNSFKSNVGGNRNVVLGVNNMSCNTYGRSNISVGNYGLEKNTLGCYNVGVGVNSLRCNTTGNSNVGIGAQALSRNTTGGSNTAVGAGALLFNNGQRNTAVGYESLCSFLGQTNNNVAVGFRSGRCILGSNNVILGGFTGSSAVNNANNNIFISDGVGNLRVFITGSNGLATFFGTGGVSASAFTGSLTGTLSGTASWALNALTASTADSFFVRQDISASNALFTGTITAQRLVVQTVSSSVIYSSGSNIFGDDVTDVQQMTGSVRITGSLTVNGPATINDLTGSLFGTASWALNVPASGVVGLNLSQISSGSVSASVNVNSASFQITSASSQLLFVSNSGLITGRRLFLSSSQNTVSGSTLTVYGSGSSQPVLTVLGSQGELFSVTDTLSGSLFSVNDISGLPVIEAFSDNSVLIGSYQAPMLTTTVRTTLAVGNNMIYQNVPTASYDAVFFEYSLKSGSNARAGSIMGIWSGSDANYNEVVTADFGDTTGVKFMVMVTGSNVALTGSAITANWTMKTIVRSI